MQKYKKWKQVLSVSTAVCLCIAGAGSLMGCGSTDGGKDKADSVESKAMGRYLENELSVPEGCMEIVDLQVMKEGSLKMLARNSDYELMLYQSSDKGKTWEEGKKVAGFFGVEGESIYKAALGRDGSILIGVYIESEDENSMGSMEYYYCPADGEGKKVEIGEALDETMAWSIDIGENGNLFLQISGNGIWEINPVDGAVVHEYEKGKSTDYMCVTAEYLIVIADGDVHYYDVASGKPAGGGDALTAQLKKTPANLEFGNSSGTALLFLDGDEKNTIFYVDQTGLYRYAFGGNVIEQVIDGSLNSISSSNKAFNCMAMDQEGVFYIGEIDYSSGLNCGRLVSYKYSADTPTVPDTELTIYSLEENSGIRQAVVMFQKKYPDILILDGISSETYAEQGMLEDLSGILKEAGLLDNIESAYTKEDGSIYEMPVKFGIPMIEGNKEDVQAVTDLASLADVLTKHKDEYGLTSENIYKLPLLYSMYPQALLEKLADNNSAAWMKADGTLDEEKIKEFLEQSERIYQAGKDAMDELKAAYPQAFDDSEQPVYERAGSISGETAVLLSRNCEFALGDIFSPLDFAFVNSMAEIDTSLAYALWNGQMANCFIPVSRIGISSRASQKAAAEKFVEYLFSEEGQMLSREDGFPVVESVYNGEDYWNQGEAGNVLVTGGSSNSENGQELVYSIKVPSADKVNELKQLGKMLTTPVLDNTIITSAVCENGVRYLNGDISLDEAANAVMQQVNLYLAE